MHWDGRKELSRRKSSMEWPQTSRPGWVDSVGVRHMVERDKAGEAIPGSDLLMTRYDGEVNGRMTEHNVRDDHNIGMGCMRGRN